MKNKIRVAELFAGVGGFRIGLEGWNGKSSSSQYLDDFKSFFEVVWSNQWEPSTKIQHASNVYENRFLSGIHSNSDISDVDISEIPEHDLLVGGFPCQDYSVATTLRNSKGLIGKKGVLWWSIRNILTNIPTKPKYLILENVDRLLISPSKQRGRDFAIILKSLNDLGYAVEWRIINAADYGMPQRRKRVFILAYHSQTSLYKDIINNINDWILNKGTLAKAFPHSNSQSTPVEFKLNEDIIEISNHFNSANTKKYFENSGLMINGFVTSYKTIPEIVDNGIKLGDILIDDDLVDEGYYINDENDLLKWQSLKGSKNVVKINRSGIHYKYSEGSMSFPDYLDRPSRTIITGEGGKSPSRFKHVIQTKNGLRRLTPIELERLNMFPDNHTQLDGITDTKRAFFMGNALVVGVIEKIGNELISQIKNG